MQLQTSKRMGTNRLSICFICILLGLGNTASAQTYYWNGGNPSASPAAGGSGTFLTAGNWRSPTATSSAPTNPPQSSIDTCVYQGTAGTVTVSGSAFAQNFFNVSGYTLATTSTNLVSLYGITIASNDTINISTNPSAATGGGIKLSSVGGLQHYPNGINGSTGSVVMFNGVQGANTPGKAYVIQFTASALNISAPIYISSTTVSGNTNVAGLVVAPSSGTVNDTITGNIINNTTMPTALGTTTTTSNLYYAGVISGTADLHICDGPGTGAGAVVLNNNNTYTGNTYIDGSSTGTQKLKLGTNNALPTTTNVVLGSSSSSTSGGVFALNGYNQEIASLASSGSHVGSVTNGATSTLTNNSQAAASVLTISGASSTNFTLPITDGATFSLGLVRSGTGTLTLSVANTFTGGIKINSGGISVNTDSRLGGVPGSATTNITINGGTLYTTASFTMNSNRTIALGPTSGTSNNDTINTASGTTLTYGGKFINNGGTGGLVKTGAGTLLLNGSAASSFTGVLNIAAGTLTLNPGTSNVFGPSTSSAPTLTMNGGNLSTTSIAASTAILFNTLTVTDHSVIILDGTNAHSISFAASSGVTWTSGKKLVITGWTGGYNGTAGTTGRIYVGSSAGDLSASQLAQILFYNGTNYYTATQITGGEIVASTLYPYTDYYSGASGNLDVTGTWYTKLYPNAGSTASSFTANNQVFHIDSSSAGTISGSSWTVSGTGSSISVDQSTDLTINSTQPINATINVGPGRTLTINNSTYPTLGVLDPTATIKYGGTSNNIPSSQTTFPNLQVSSPTTISANTTVNCTLMMSSGNLNLNGHTITVNSIAGSSPSSAITGSATSGLIINGNTTGSLYFDQTSTATSSLDTLTVNGNATLGNTLNIPGGTTPGIVTVASGDTLNANGNLTLISDANGTGHIGTVSGKIIGNVNIQRFIPGQRGYRLLGHPYTTNLDLTSLEASFDVTGIPGAGSGCVNTNPSVFRYTAGTGGYTGITNGTAAFPAAQSGSSVSNGILAFIRGAKGQDCTTSGTTPPSNITFTTASSVNTGDIVETVPANGWNLISNPYPSQVLLSSVTNISSLNAILVVQPGQQNGGNTYTNGSSYYAASSSYILPINGAFLANNTTGSDIALTFHESSKNNGTPTTGILKTTSVYPSLELSVYKGNSFWDSWEMSLRPGASGNAGEDGDLDKMANAQFNISSTSTDNKTLAWDARDESDIADGYVMGLGISSVPNTYTLTVSKYSLPASKIVYLHDKYTNTYTLITNGVSYPFTVNTDATSQGQRLELLFNDISNNTGIGNVANHASGIVVVPNPATSNINLNYSSSYSGVKDISIINVVGQVVRQVTTTDQTITIPVSDLANGVYMIKTTVNSKTATERFIKN